MVSLVGNLLGENEPMKAYRMYRVNHVPLGLFFASISLLILIFREPLATLFSGESEARDIEARALIYLALHTFFNLNMSVFYAPFYAMKKQG